MMSQAQLASRARLRCLIRAVDAFEGDPTEDDVCALAKEYGDTPNVVRIVFEARPDRACQRNPASGHTKRGDCWLPEEDSVIVALWSARNGDLVTVVDDQIAASLTSLPVNVARRVVRSGRSVKDRRQKLGITAQARRAE